MLYCIRYTFSCIYKPTFRRAKNSFVIIVVVVGECERAHLRERKRAVIISSEKSGGQSDVLPCIYLHFFFVEVDEYL